MAIRILNPDSDYGWILLKELSISQSYVFEDSTDPIYTISLAWGRYKITPDGAITHDSAHGNTYYSGSFYADAVTNMLNGNNVLMSALLANQSAVASIIAGETAMQLEVI